MASGRSGKAVREPLSMAFLNPFSMCERLSATRMMIMVGYIACEYRISRVEIIREQKEELFGTYYDWN